MNWIPTVEQKKYVELIASMSIDCMLGRGTSSREAYTTNLRITARLLDEIKEDEPDT